LEEVCEEEKELQDAYQKFQARFSPAAFVRSAILEVRESLSMKHDLLKVVLGLGAGYLSKKLIAPKTASLPKKILGNILQYGIAAFVASDSTNDASVKQNLIAKVRDFANKLRKKRQET